MVMMPAFQAGDEGSIPSKRSTNGPMVGYLPSKQTARVRFPVGAHHLSSSGLRHLMLSEETHVRLMVDGREYSSMVEHEVATLGTAVRFRLFTDFIVLLVSMSGCEPEGASSILAEVRTYGVVVAQQALNLLAEIRFLLRSSRLAQLVEHQTLNLGVMGSSPIVGTLFIKQQ